MFWLAVIGGSLVLLHALLLMILKYRKQDKEKQSYGALIFPRFEIFLLIFALPCISEASAALIKGTSKPTFLHSDKTFSANTFLLKQHWCSHCKDQHLLEQLLVF